MKKLFAVLVVAIAFATVAAAQVNLPLNGLGTPSEKKVKPTSKTVTGTVTDKSDQPIANAVVYLKNSKTLVVKSFFTQDNGSYRFPQVTLNTDYEVWAEKDGKKSPVKSVSQFDDRFTPVINMQIDTSK
ncbi:MAG TPA: carboxypeptidase-like regulatory domain-containing protein [Candidatus Angelobacter sp.]|jgi:ribosomal protein L15E|nr:carboxypeptidase-like regulatory domain-containing protein [Candidatus Angelobacter sp.]